MLWIVTVKDTAAIALAKTKWDRYDIVESSEIVLGLYYGDFADSAISGAKNDFTDIKPEDMKAYQLAAESHRDV